MRDLLIDAIHQQREDDIRDRRLKRGEVCRNCNHFQVTEFKEITPVKNHPGFYEAPEAELGQCRYDLPRSNGTDAWPTIKGHDWCRSYTPQPMPRSFWSRILDRITGKSAH